MKNRMKQKLIWFVNKDYVAFKILSEILDAKNTPRRDRRVHKNALEL